MSSLIFPWLRRACLLGASIVVALVVCEALLRLAGVSYPVFDDFDDTRGFRLRPGKEGWYRAEGEAFVSINSLGYRDREHDRAKPANTARIAVLGDSLVEARQVALEDTFWHRLGGQLEACGAFGRRQIDVMSFGVGGYNTSQEYMTLKQDVLGFSPDLVIVAFFAHNDVEGNQPDPDYRGWRMPVPTHRVVDGALVLNESSGHSVLRRILYEVAHHSRVLELVNEARRRSGSLTAPPPAAAEVEPGLDVAIFKPPETPDWHEAWGVTEALLAEMDALARRHGAQLVVVTIPSAIQVDPTTRRREALEARLGVDDLLYPDRRVAAMGARRGFETYPLTGELQEIAEDQQIYLHGFANTQLGAGHLNEQGHRVLAEVLATRLCHAAGDWRETGVRR